MSVASPLSVATIRAGPSTRKLTRSVAVGTGLPSASTKPTVAKARSRPSPAMWPRSSDSSSLTGAPAVRTVSLAHGLPSR